MRLRGLARRCAASSLQRPCHPRQWRARRHLMTLAIETSCDDTSVAILEKDVVGGRSVAKLHFHDKVTSKNTDFRGVHPLVSLESHQKHLACMVNRALQFLPPGDDVRSESRPPVSASLEGRRLPDFISVTRGPGMGSNLSTGLDTAKGLAAAWQIPLVGVHHMQAHALTPRLTNALESPLDHQYDMPLPETNAATGSPDFPFLSVLASGGHTLLLHSATLTHHQLLGSTTDIALGLCLDKVARAVLPEHVLTSAQSTMYGALLEQFADPHVQPGPTEWPQASLADSYVDAFKDRYPWYTAPLNQELAKEQTLTKWGWSLTQPLSKAGGGVKSRSLDMSFTGLTTAAQRNVQYHRNSLTGRLTSLERDPDNVSVEERRDMARETMRAAFEHVSSRVILALKNLDSGTVKPAVVLAGGVAANAFLRFILAKTLCMHGYSHTVLHFPPPKYCTDNAAMIGWAGLEMFEAGFTDALSTTAVRKWPLDRLLDAPEIG